VDSYNTAAVPPYFKHTLWIRARFSECCMLPPASSRALVQLDFNQYAGIYNVLVTG